MKGVDWQQLTQVACEMQAAAEDLLEGLEFDSDSNEVLALVRDSHCSAYDCEFVALARRLEVPLVTMDGKVLEGFPDHTVRLTSFQTQ